MMTEGEFREAWFSFFEDSRLVLYFFFTLFSALICYRLLASHKSMQIA